MAPIDRREYLKHTGALAGVPVAYGGVARARDRREDGDGSSDRTTTDGGRIGWGAYRELGRLPLLSGDDGVETKQFSSFDRTGGNDDGFDGAYSCLRETADGRCVIAEANGPGEVASMWFTRFGPDGAGDVTRDGAITIELDGQTVLEAPLQDVVEGALGAPFEYPLVADAHQSSGGVYVKVPMPFRERMRIVTDDMRFYRVVYRTFADADGVETFDPSEPAHDVLETLRNAGTADPKDVDDATTGGASFGVDAGETVTLDSRTGPGVISALRLRFPEVVGPDRRDEVVDDGRAFGESGSSSFTVAVDPANDGVRLTRRLSFGPGQQHARILVDGDAVAEWPGVPRERTTWADQTVELPASATSGTAELDVENEFVSSRNDFNEFTYWVESLVGGEWVQTDVLDVGLNSTDSENAHDYAITNQTWSGVNRGFYPTEYGEDALSSSKFLRNARIRMRFDGKQTVDAPLGEFFGSGIGEAEVRSLFFAMDTGEDGWYSSWWPMPYQRSATIELYNGSDVPIADAEVEVTAARSSEWARELGPDGDAGYFHATSNSGETTVGDDWIFLDAYGRGKFVGVTHTAENDELDRSYLEGDERVYVDGSRYPQIHGTGSEDYYEGGWYFKFGLFSNPMNGYPVHEVTSPLCESICTGFYRVMVPDEVPFSSSLRFGMEHGPTNEATATYSSTAYWYGRERPALERTDALDVGDAESETAHDYASDSPGAVEEVTSTFVGDFQNVEVTEDLRETASPVTFTLSVDVPNEGVRIRRTADHERAYQAARVFVNDEAVGVWEQPLGNETHRWIDDAFEVPADVTGEADTLRVRLEPLGDAPPWRAARYEAFVHTRPFEDDEAPTQVTGLRAAGGSGETTLSWDAASDNVVVDGYEVYGSKRADFSVGSDTLIGRSPAAGFAHDDLGLNETWHYRVRAVDGAGNVGAASEPASATTESTVRVEGEALLPPEEATDRVIEQPMTAWGSDWSGDEQLFFRADAPGDHVTGSFDLPDASTYAVTAVFTKARDYGIHELSFDGEATGQTFDGYDPNVVRSDRIGFGEFAFEAGQHTLTLTLTGKNSASDGYFAGIDYVEFEALE